MSEGPFDIRPSIFKDSHPPVNVIPCHENDLTQVVLGRFLETATDGRFGVAPAYGAKCVLSVLAFSTPSQVLLIRLSKQKTLVHGKKAGPSKGRQLVKGFFCVPTHKYYAFRMDKLAAALHHDLGLRISCGVDLLSATKADRQSLDAIMGALGGEMTLNKSNVSALFKQEESVSASPQVVALQAWAACRAATLESMALKLGKIPKIATLQLNEKHLDILAKTIRDADRLTAIKPTRVKNEVDAKFSHKQGKVHLTSSRFKTRVMSDRSQTLQIETTVNGKSTIVAGRATKVAGRAATVSLNGTFSGSAIRSVTTVGRESPTSAEGLRQSIILMALQNGITIMKHPFVQSIWLPEETVSWLNTPSTTHPVSLHFPSPRNLNVSQAKAVNIMLSNDNADRVVLVHGPPGTGKTTVIAATVTSVMASADRNRTLWLVAQSNVAVKNIAEKLAAVNFFDFKLLVSREFHFDWHEHLYQKITTNLIRSDDFVDDVVAVERLLLGSRVILCTLSMLSNSRLPIFMRLVPPQTVIFDEASQIEVGDYFPMLHRFQPTLRKLVFIGDDKQLAPYGQGDIPDLVSIFEMPHLRKRAVFLDTQYRMPVPIGSFISRNVYNNRLKTVHPITAPSSCEFIDVHNGHEERKGVSWMNYQEIQVAMSLAQKMNAQGKSYRIITPYDAQRSQLENALKAAKLPWEDKCFNVDSFQGNEADYIILSVVRSDKIGFLKEDRRVNVMLTRCKKRMFICTNRAFIEGKASKSLVGRLAVGQLWLQARQVRFGNFAL